MFFKLKTIYLSHLKLAFAINCFVTCYFSYLFYLNGFDKSALYTLALFFKAIGYGFTVAIERLFFLNRSYFYRNMGLGYKKVFGSFMALDCLLFVFILMVVALWKSFI